MATLAPVLDSGIAVEQPSGPVDSVGGSLGKTFAALYANRPTPAKPSEKDKEGDRLRALSTRLDDLHNSNLSPSRRIAEGRKVLTDYIALNPQDTPAAKGVAEQYGVVSATIPTTTEDAFTAQRNRLIESPEFAVDMFTVQQESAGKNLTPDELATAAINRGLAREANKTRVEELKTQKEVNWYQYEEVFTKQIEEYESSLVAMVNSTLEDQIVSIEEGQNVLNYHYSIVDSIRKPSNVSQTEWDNFKKERIDPLTRITQRAVDLTTTNPVNGITKRAITDILNVLKAKGELPPSVDFVFNNSNSSAEQTLELIGKLVSNEDGKNWTDSLTNVNTYTYDELLAWATDFDGKTSLDQVRTGNSKIPKLDYKDFSKKSGSQQLKSIEASNNLAVNQSDDGGAALAIDDVYDKLAYFETEAITIDTFEKVFTAKHFKTLNRIYEANPVVGKELIKKGLSTLADTQIKIANAIQSKVRQTNGLVTMENGKLILSQEAVNTLKDKNFTSVTITDIERHLVAFNRAKEAIKTYRGFLPEEFQDQAAGSGEGGGGGTGEQVDSLNYSDTPSLTVSLIKGFEGFSSSAYWDVNAYRVGHGSDTITKSDGTIVKVEKGSSVSEPDAQRDLERRIQEFARKAATKVGLDVWSSLPGNVTAALTSIAYNYGSIPDRLMEAIGSGDNETIALAVEGLADDNDGINRNRRMKEAAVIRGATLEASSAPIYTDRPQHRGEGTESARASSPRPAHRDGTPTSNTAQSASSQPSGASEGVSGKDASATTVQTLSDRTVAMLSKAGIDVGSVRQFTTEEELSAAIQAGEVKEGDYVSVGQEVFQL